MRAWMTRWLLVAVALLTACGGGADLTKARVRLVNASSGYSALDMSIDDSRRFSSIGYGSTADYVEVDPDKMSSTIGRPGSATALLSLTPSVSKDRNYTVLAYGVEGSLKSLVLDDNTGEPDSGKTLLRVLNAAPDAGAVDVYLTGSDDTLADAVPLQANAAVGTLNGYVSPINSATWRLRVTAAGDKTDLRLDVAALALGSKQVTTLVITPGRGGVLVNALLLVDRGAIVRADGAQARVRVAAAVPPGGSVTASVGGTTLMSAVGAPAVGLYALVTAGTPTASASVNGTAATGSAPTLAAGGDYTLLVYGPVSAPVVSWIEDDNRRPSASSSARLRLVHGVADLAATLSLTSDFLPIADGVAQGAGSAYTSVTATTTAALSVTTPGVATAVYTATDKTFAAGANYTLFLAGTAAAPVGILRQDR